jgi:hypothetical protein
MGSVFGGRWWVLMGCYWRGKIQPLRLVSQAGSMCGDELPIYAKKAH